MAGIRKTAAGTWRADWRDPTGRQESTTFRTKTEAKTFVAQLTAATTAGAYVSPHAGRVLFGEHARDWMASWNTEASTTARDASIMRTHVIRKWGDRPLSKIDRMAIQTWITDPGKHLSPATVAECRRLTSGCAPVRCPQPPHRARPERGRQGSAKAPPPHPVPVPRLASQPRPRRPTRGGPSER